MKKEMVVEITSKYTIKPSSPTPRNHKTYKVCLFDQTSPPCYVSIFLFYTAEDVQNINNIKTSQCLKKSLSETLTRFYPLAGRVKDDAVVDCSDQGADYIEARVEGQLLDVLRYRDSNVLLQFLPFGTYSGLSPILGVQVNLFSCGGLAIGLCASHKIVDGFTLTSFLSCWASNARGESDNKDILMVPTFNLSSLFPPREPAFFVPALNRDNGNVMRKLFLFEGSKVAALREKATCLLKPTRVEAVCALIWRCAMKATRGSNPAGLVKQSAASFVVNMRGKMLPAKHSFGNFIHGATAMPDDGSHELHELADYLHDSISMIDVGYVKSLQNNVEISDFLEFVKYAYELKSTGEVDIFLFTSWCRFGIYEADFGWGRPTWATTIIPVKNVVILIDSKDGQGIETWVNLDREDMALFEQDPELLEFVSSPQKLDVGL